MMSRQSCTSGVLRLLMTSIFCQRCAATPSTLIAQVPSPESIVALSDGYLVSSIGKRGSGQGIYKFAKDGTAQGAVLTNTVTKGLAMTKDQATLYAAHNGKVSQYSITSSGLSLVEDHAMPLALPNGVCLTEDETTLFVTDPGYKLSAMGVSEDPNSVGGLAKIDLATGSVTTIFTDQRDSYSPNGCKVIGGKVYMINSKHGVTTYDTSSTKMEIPAWAGSLAIIQSGSPQFVGDGIVALNGAYYLSLWRIAVVNGQPSPDGAIWKCTVEGCAEHIQGVAAADIDLDGNHLLMPILMAGKVLSEDLSSAPSSPSPTPHSGGKCTKIPKNVAMQFRAKSCD